MAQVVGFPKKIDKKASVYFGELFRQVRPNSAPITNLSNGVCLRNLWNNTTWSKKSKVAWPRDLKWVVKQYVQIHRVLTRVFGTDIIKEKFYSVACAVAKDLAGEGSNSHNLYLKFLMPLVTDREVQKAALPPLKDRPAFVTIDRLRGHYRDVLVPKLEAALGCVDPSSQRDVFHGLAVGIACSMALNLRLAPGSCRIVREAPEEGALRPGDDNLCYVPEQGPVVLYIASDKVSLAHRHKGGKARYTNAYELSDELSGWVRRSLEGLPRDWLFAHGERERVAMQGTYGSMLSAALQGLGVRVSNNDIRQALTCHYFDRLWCSGRRRELLAFSQSMRSSLDMLSRIYDLPRA